MPDVFRQRNVLTANDSVCIPDFVFPVANEPSDDTGSDEDSCASAPDGGTAEDIAAVQEPQKPQRPPVVAVPNVLSREELAQQYRAELDDIRAEAAQQAYAEALRRKKGELSDCLEQVDRHLKEMDRLQLQYIQQYTEELKYLAIEIAEKMVLHKISEDDTYLAKLVMQTVGNVKNASWLNVELSEHLVTLVDFVKQELAKLDTDVRLSVTPMACPDDTCRVNTEDGTVVATLSVQAQNLREAFKAADAAL